MDQNESLTAEQEAKDRHIHNCKHHPPQSEGEIGTHDAARKYFTEMGCTIINLTPPGRERALALTKLEEAQQWTHAAIARNHYSTPHVDMSTVPKTEAGK